MLVLDLLNPLPRLAEVFLSIELLAFLLDNDSINVGQTKVSGDFWFLNQNLLLKFIEIFGTVNLEILNKLRGVKPENLCLLDLGPDIFPTISVIFTELSGILRILILTVPFSFIGPKNVI